MTSEDHNSLQPTSSREVRLPPHPLDSEWLLFIGSETYGPFSGHQLKNFIQDGRLNADTYVARSGEDNWIRAGDVAALVPLFRPAAPPSKQPPTGPVSAAEGATIVQVTNNIAPQQPLVMDIGEAKPKSAGTALILSILVVGLGQIYNGQVGKGIGMFFLCVGLWFILLGWIINIWSWVDAYTTARDMNLRYQRRLAMGLPI